VSFIDLGIERRMKMENFMCCIRRRILPNLIHKIPSQVGIPVVGRWPSTYMFYEIMDHSIHFWDFLNDFIGDEVSVERRV
jgi:hypothetical protein